MSNSASYKLYAHSKLDDLEKLKTWMGDRNNFPYYFQWQLISSEDDENGKVVHELTVQAEERNRGFSGADGYLMEISEKFPEIEIPITSQDGLFPMKSPNGKKGFSMLEDYNDCEYDDEHGEGVLSKKEDGFEKLKDYSGKIDLIELSKLETDENDKIVKNTAFNIWMESKDNGKTATVHYETGDAMKVWKGEEEMKQGTHISEPIPLIEAEMKLRELERKKDGEGFH